MPLPRVFLGGVVTPLNLSGKSGFGSYLNLPLKIWAFETPSLWNFQQP